MNLFITRENRITNSSGKKLLNRSINVIPLTELLNRAQLRPRRSVPSTKEDYRLTTRREINVVDSLKYFQSYTRLSSECTNSWHRSMSYVHLLRAFSGNNYMKVFAKSNNSQHLIMACNGMIAEKVSDGKPRILACVVVKKEWLVDFQYRLSVGIKPNPKCYGLLIDSSFDTKDYVYKGLRSFFRNEVKPLFEDILEVDDIVSLFKKDIKLPSFLAKEQKTEWEKDIFSSYAETIKVEEEPQEVGSELPF